MRDRTNRVDSFNGVINSRIKSNENRIHKLKNNLIKSNRVITVKQEMSKNLLYLSISKYSEGFNLTSLKADLISAIKLAHEGWDGFWKLKSSKGKELNQYILSAYDEMIWMLSLAFLLDIPNEEFKKLTEVIDRDGVKDYLFEFIIKAKISNRESVEKESYEESFGVPKVFEKLRQAINENKKFIAEKLVKDFIITDWYKNHKDAGWYNSHKSKHATYFGYWSFETAAVVSIMNLDDSSFRDNQYYPKDLVDYYRSNHPKA